MEATSSGGKGQIAALIDAIDSGIGPLDASKVMGDSLPVNSVITGEEFTRVREAVARAMDRTGFGTVQWDAWFAILNALDDGRQRSLAANPSDVAAYADARAAFAIERILNAARRQGSDGSTTYDPAVISRLVAMADSRGMLSTLGKRGEELRQLGRGASFIGPPSYKTWFSPLRAVLQRARRRLAGRA